MNYQTVICDLTGMELSNASLLDEGTSAAEAMTMLFSNRDREKVNNNCNKFFVADDVFDQTLDVLMTRAEPLGIEIVKNSIEAMKNNITSFRILKNTKFSFDRNEIKLYIYMNKGPFDSHWVSNGNSFIPTF